MKKTVKIILTVLIVLALTIGCGLLWLQHRPAVPDGYQSQVAAGTKAEQIFLENGPYAAEEFEEPAMQNFSKYEVFYPDTARSGKDQLPDRLPVVVLCNGTGIPLSRYKALAEHYASWGFVVIGTEEQYSWNGFGARMCLEHLKKLNSRRMLSEDQANPLYKRIDLDAVGLAGHSQGGVGVLNAAADGGFRTAVALSCTNMALADSLEWSFDPSRVSVPMLLVSGAGGGDDWVVTGDQLKEIQDRLAGPSVSLRRKDTPHGEMLYSADGLVTAWLLWQLQQNQEAKELFEGPDAQILTNPAYQDLRLVS